MPSELKAPTPEVLAQFAAIVGEKGVLTAPADVQPYCQEWRDKYFGRDADGAPARVNGGGRRHPQARP